MKKTLNLVGSILGTVATGIYSVSNVMGVIFVVPAMFTSFTAFLIGLIFLALVAFGIVALIFNIIAIVKTAKKSNFRIVLTAVLNFIFAGLILINCILGSFGALDVVMMLLTVAAGVLMLVAKNK